MKAQTHMNVVSDKTEQVQEFVKQIKEDLTNTRFLAMGELLLHYAVSHKMPINIIESVILMNLSVLQNLQCQWSNSSARRALCV